MDALKILGHDRPNPSSRVPLAAQSRDEPEPYSLPAKTTKRSALSIVFGRIKKCDFFAFRKNFGEAAFFVHHFIFDTNVGKGSTNHHFMIPAPGAVGVEIFGVHALCDQILSRRRVLPIIPAGEI